MRTWGGADATQGGPYSLQETESMKEIRERLQGCLAFCALGEGDEAGCEIHPHVSGDMEAENWTGRGRRMTAVIKRKEMRRGGRHEVLHTVGCCSVHAKKMQVEVCFCSCRDA